MASRYTRIPLNALRVFEATATRLSFSEAAEVLNVTPAAVSQQIKALEDYVQIPLLRRRRGRTVELTREGAQLLHAVQRGLDVLLDALGELRNSTASGALHVSTLASTLQKWLALRLHRLNEQHPELQLSWHTSQQAVDFAQDGVHAAIRFGPGPYPDMYAQHLMDEWSVVVASPEVVRRHGMLDDHRDLAGLPLLHATHEPWSRWQQNTVKSAATTDAAVIDDSVSVLAAAAESLGYAVARWTLAAADIESGRLVLASSRAEPSPWHHWFVCPVAYRDVPKVAALRDWLVAEAAMFAPPPTAVSPGSGRRRRVQARRQQVTSGRQSSRTNR